MQALSMLGTPYHYGGESPSGFDCSGLVQYSYHQADIRVPRTARQQYRASQRIPKGELRPGDLVFFQIDARKPTHVGLYLGRNQFVHAPSRGEQVHRSNLGNRYWRKHFLAAGRLLP